MQKAIGVNCAPFAGQVALAFEWYKKKRVGINSRMPRHSCCEVRVMQLHDILLLRTSAILPEAISAGGLTPTTDTSLFLTTYRGGSHLPADILLS